MSSKGPLKYRELLRRLKHYGVVELQKRGKGSERILLLPESPGAKRGRQITVKHHGDSTEIYLPVILAVLRRFEIDPAGFWKS